MSINTSAPWHKTSFDRFLHDRLPQLLAERSPLTGYRVEATGAYTCHVKVALGDVEAEYADVPQPDEEGIFKIDGQQRVVIPIASQEELDVAEVRCVGEQLYDYVEERLGEAPDNMPWDTALVKAWLPLDTWVCEFMQYTSQLLQQTNWLDRYTHPRRLILKERKKVITPGHFGRVCFIETPEGPNIARVLSVAVGAEIRDGKLVVVNGRPEARLSVSASMIPFLEHSDTNRLLMGANMMRQWMTPPDPEPALVQTGNEPDVSEFWCGRNLLTAYVSWGADTFEDAIVISESCAKKLNYPYPVEPGDKLSNRHGSKGVVSRVLPDDEMPHLADGTPVEIVFHFMGLYTRLNFGQTREAVIGRMAHAEGKPVIVPPFHAPTEEELRKRLETAGFPLDGMEVLTMGRNGRKLQRPSLVGWVYWGRLHQVARDKIHATVDATRPQGQSAPDYAALRAAGAFENVLEQFNTRSAERNDADTLSARVAAGNIVQASPPSPKFAELTERLAVVGIRAEFEGEKLSFQFAPPVGNALKLACPVPHPWLRERELTEVGEFKEMSEYGALVEANEKMARMLTSKAPDRLTQKARADLEFRVKDFFDALVNPSHMRFGGRVLFSGRAVITPGADLRIDQIGLPDEMAWTLFAPLLVRELGSENEVRSRSPQATQRLDALMSRSWVIAHRAPAVTPTAFIAFHPVRCEGRVLRLHPLACPPLNADFDGDLMAVFLPLTEAAQREAGEKLSIAGHLKRDPQLLKILLPTDEAMWGLASLSLTPEGRREIAHLAGTEVAAPEGFITRDTLLQAMQRVWERDGILAMLESLERLMRRGFEVTKESGASMSPFFGASVKRPPEPQSDEGEAWEGYAEELMERLASRTDFGDNDIGPQLLGVKSGARGQLRHLALHIGARTIPDFDERSVPVRHGYRDGLTPDELCAHSIGAWKRLAQFLAEMGQMVQGWRSGNGPQGFNVLARAMRAKHPGIVFARAAAVREIDPLTDVDSRLFVGLPIGAVHG